MLNRLQACRQRSGLGSLGTKNNVQWKLLHPRNTEAEALALQISVDAGEMVDQTQVELGEPSKLVESSQAELGEGEDAGSQPGIDLGLDGSGPQHVRCFRTPGHIVRWWWTILVVASAIVLGAISANSIQVSMDATLLVAAGSSSYHWGKCSSQRMCLFLHVLQPLRDFVWLLRGGPPPGPAILRRPWTSRAVENRDRSKIRGDASGVGKEVVMRQMWCTQP